MERKIWVAEIVEVMHHESGMIERRIEDYGFNDYDNAVRYAEGIADERGYDVAWIDYDQAMGGDDDRHIRIDLIHCPVMD